VHVDERKIGVAFARQIGHSDASSTDSP
jgi:hypothetical protein